MSKLISRRNALRTGLLASGGWQSSLSLATLPALS